MQPNTNREISNDHRKPLARYGAPYGRASRAACSTELHHEGGHDLVVYDIESCDQSENTKWEIERAKLLGKTIIELSRDDIEKRNVGQLVSAYEFANEFHSCFPDKAKNEVQLFDLYKIMVNSSEQLIQRRQITNGFFITIIGAIVGAIGFAFKEKIVTETGVLVLVLPIFIGLLMCRSWGNLIDNYGKLNAGKFKVIHKLEGHFEAREPLNKAVAEIVEV